MTTIAFRDGVMASDSCITSDGHVQVASVIKVFRTSAGALIGQAGDADCRAVFALLDKVKNAKALPSKEEIEKTRTDFELLMAFGPKDVWYVGGQEYDDSGRYSGYVYPAAFPFAATGSGWKFALAAMRCGKSAKEAIVVACDFDRFSKLPIHALSFAPPKPRSKPKPKPK
jgi:ATP-dependent protease HslVU (ClpYQ) peptidase subunit